MDAQAVHWEPPTNVVAQPENKRIQVHYDASKPDTSVLLERELEMIALLQPELR